MHIALSDFRKSLSCCKDSTNPCIESNRQLGSEPWKIDRVLFILSEASSCVFFFFFCRAANLILNLFNLMLDAGVPDIALEPDKTVQKV